MGEQESVNKEVVGQGILPWQNVATEFSGNFDISASNKFRDTLDPPTAAKPDRQDFFGMAAAGAFAQGQLVLAERLLVESKKPISGILQAGSYPDVATSKFPKKFTPNQPAGDGWRDEGEKWVRYESAEEMARGELAQALAIALVSVAKSSDGKGDTMVDIHIQDGIQKEVFLYLTRLLVKDPTSIGDARVNIEQERFEHRAVTSVVPGYDFIQWRHNPRKGKFGHDDDMVKIALEKSS